MSNLNAMSWLLHHGPILRMRNFALGTTDIFSNCFDESKHRAHSPVMFSAVVNRLLQSYPKIYLACHTRHVRDDASGKALSPHMGSVLDHLTHDPPLSISELARHLDLNESTVSLHVSKLERSGYIRRVRDERDHRRVRVQLTASGLRVKKENAVLDPELVTRMMSLLGPVDAEAALHGLELLADAAARLMDNRQVRKTRKAQ